MEYLTVYCIIRNRRSNRLERDGRTLKVNFKRVFRSWLIFRFCVRWKVIFQASSNKKRSTISKLEKSSALWFKFRTWILKFENCLLVIGFISAIFDGKSSHSNSPPWSDPEWHLSIRLSLSTLPPIIRKWPFVSITVSQRSIFWF